MTLLAVDHLSIRASQNLLVADLSFAIAPGERLGLVGESGSGKSLTAMAAIGLLAGELEASGSVILGGSQVIGAPSHSLDRLRGTVAATIFQEPLTALDPLMRVGHQVAEPLHRRARRDQRRIDLEGEVMALLGQVALPDPLRVARAYPHELSGGQRQRVAIAMALACRPQLLIADEPTTALDVTTQAEILSLLDSLVRARNMAMLFISHDLPVVAGIVDRVIVLQHGVAVERGDVREVFAAPQHPYTRALVRAARTFDAGLDSAP